MKNDNLNREQTKETLLNIISKLDTEKQQLLYAECLRIHNRSLMERLGHQTCHCDLAAQELYNYVKAARAEKLDEFIILSDIFAYGVIHGIRKERARRAHRKVPAGILYP